MLDQIATASGSAFILRAHDTTKSDFRAACDREKTSDYDGEDSVAQPEIRCVEVKTFAQAGWRHNCVSISRFECAHTIWVEKFRLRMKTMNHVTKPYSIRALTIRN